MNISFIFSVGARFLGVGALVLAIALPSHAAMVFKHPGALSTNSELLFVKQKIQSNTEPWAGEFKELKRFAVSGGNKFTYLNSKNDADANLAKVDGQKAYANALAWHYTGEDIYAKQAIEILNVWADFQGFNGGNDQDKLTAGWIGALLGPAAELMRGYSQWNSADKARLQAMFKRAFYPQLNTASNWNGNVDLTQIDAIMNIAVFNEDEAAFMLGIARLKQRIPAYFYLASDGTVPSIDGDGGNYKKFWSNPEKWVDGLTQETCRDNNHHSQYGLASALHATEVAWNQGVDLYTENTKRFTATMELMATQLLTGDMQGVCSNNRTTKDLYATWEIGYNHYHNRKNLSLPNTKKLLHEKVRKNSRSDWNIFYETLTHNLDMPSQLKALDR